MTTPQPAPPPRPGSGRPPVPGPTWSPFRVTVLVLLAILALAAVAYGAAHVSSTRAGSPVPAVAGPGDCVALASPTPTQAAGRAAPEAGQPVRLVDCDSTQARYTVIQVFPAGTDVRRCAEVPGAEFALSQRVGVHSALVCAEHSDVQGRAQNE
ncbi:hypothetical protein [Streptacidiphilus sp. P02-A3a]|uniref:LppU/SCO3897 family protein n=1 Tax=Streptacidiphilus sp. P02-A3a TaxID=2704468 RepID=UPI0015FBB775|nr:hypothetical protein [Streptacidiphilus sp. P02-A3a]QMU69541.1 hypothetical protein GXP74_16160 [Streptacidiphilus sp. P02-A3a]